MEKTIWRDGIEYIVYADGTEEALVPFEDIQEMKKTADTLNERGRQKRDLKLFLAKYKTLNIGKDLTDILGEFTEESITNPENIDIVKNEIFVEQRMIESFLHSFLEITTYDSSFIDSLSQKTAKRLQREIDFFNSCLDGLDNIKEELKEVSDGRESTS